LSDERFLFCSPLNAKFEDVSNMESEQINQTDETAELPDSWWHRVYLGVIITTILVISALWAFSRYFSS
jgi:hypothetical protein